MNLKLTLCQNIKDNNFEVSTGLGNETMTAREHSLREFPYITAVRCLVTPNWRNPLKLSGLGPLGTQTPWPDPDDDHLRWKKTSPVIINGLLILVAGSPGEKKREENNLNVRSRLSVSLSTRPSPPPVQSAARKRLKHETGFNGFLGACS